MTLKLNGTNSEAAPAYAGDDADTGLQCGTNELKLVTGGTARATVDSSGRLLVGTSSTSATCTSVFAGRSDGATDPVLRLEVNSTSPANGTALGGLNFASSGLSAFQAGARIAAVRDGGTWTNGSSHPTYLEFATTADGASSPTERMRILSSGGITFNGDTAAANALDDYEVGTFTPTLAQGVTSPSYTNVGGTYIKIGDCITFTLRMRVTSGTDNSAQVLIGGLPFASSSSAREGGAFFNYRHDLNSSSAGPFMHISQNSSQITFYNNIGGAWIGTNGSGLINRTLHIQGHYYV